jgi:hypothetical protein
VLFPHCCLVCVVVVVCFLVSMLHAHVGCCSRVVETVRFNSVSAWGVGVTEHVGVCYGYCDRYGYYDCVCVSHPVSLMCVLCCTCCVVDVVRFHQLVLPQRHQDLS